MKQELVERPVERPVEQPVEQPVIDQVASSPTVDRGLKRKLDEPREELENEIRFTFKLKGVDALLASGTKKSRSSLRHNCRGEAFESKLLVGDSEVLGGYSSCLSADS